MQGSVPFAIGEADQVRLVLFAFDIFVGFFQTLEIAVRGRIEEYNALLLEALSTIFVLAVRLLQVVDGDLIVLELLGGRHNIIFITIYFKYARTTLK